MLSRSIRRCAALAAVFAITLQALWPLLSHARPAELSLLAPLCTIDGVTHYLEIKAGKSTPLDERSAQHGEHCKLCVFGSGKLAVLASATVPALLVETGSTLAVTSRQPSHQKHQLHPPAQPRAPPAIS